jgi:hypothetical protein
MTVARPAMPTVGGRKQQVVARLGKDHRFAKPPAGGQ